MFLHMVIDVVLGQSSIFIWKWTVKLVGCDMGTALWLHNCYKQNVGHHINLADSNKQFILNYLPIC